MPFLDIFSKKPAKPEQKPKIIADNREKNSLVIANLINLGAEVEFKQLEIADYIVGNTAIERKSYSDFLGSMLNKRLLEQLHHMLQYERRLLIIEKESEEQEKINIHPNAIKGMILAISLEMQTPIIQTLNEKETAEFLFILAKKQDKGKISFHSRKPKDEKEQQQYIIESFQGIGPQTAKKLLAHFKTIKAIVNAPIEEIEKLIGKKSLIFELVDREYQ